jgi:hypothetical protein
VPDRFYFTKKQKASAKKKERPPKDHGRLRLRAGPLFGGSLLSQLAITKGKCKEERKGFAWTWTDIKSDTMYSILLRTRRKE